MTDRGVRKGLATKGVLVALVALAALLLVQSRPVQGGGAWRVRDGEWLRWEGIHRQETSRSCGPASLVTFLTYYLDFPVSEQEVARRALGLGDGDVAASALQAPTSMRGLRDTLVGWGFPAYGLEMSLAGIRAYVEQTGLPLIVRITHPDPHFTLVAGWHGDHVLLADSSLGWRAFASRDFVAMWDGVVLAVDPASVPNRRRDVSPTGSLMAMPTGKTARVRPAKEAEASLGRRLEHLRWGVPR